jgi:hypothetical protein
LSIIDLLNAKCFPSGFELSKEILKTFEENPIFIDFDTEDKNEFIGLSIIKIIGLLSKKRSCKKSDLLSLDAQTIKQNWENAVNYLVNFLEFAKTHFGTIGIRFLPYKDMFVPLAVIIGDSKFDKDNDDHAKKVEKWYWTCVFTGYFDNATESKSAATVKEFLGDANNLGWLDNANQIPTLIENNKMLYTSEFNEIDNAASQQSAIYKAILNLIILNEACDFQGNKKLIKELKESDLQDHHIFPKKFLASQNPKIEKNEANTILNRTLISTIANQAIKDKQPSIYFQDDRLFKGSLLDEKDLARHFINEEFTNQKYAKGNFSKQNYDDFKRERKRQIIEIIKSKIV